MTTSTYVEILTTAGETERVECASREDAIETAVELSFAGRFRSGFVLVDGRGTSIRRMDTAERIDRLIGR